MLNSKRSCQAFAAELALQRTLCACVRAQGKEGLKVMVEVHAGLDRAWWCVHAREVVPWIGFLAFFHARALPFQRGACWRLALWRVCKAAQAARALAGELAMVV